MYVVSLVLWCLHEIIEFIASVYAFSFICSIAFKCTQCSGVRPRGDFLGVWDSGGSRHNSFGNSSGMSNLGFENPDVHQYH